MVLEGTYPYVRGGVSSWAHDIVKSLPELSFSLLHIGPRPGAYGKPAYEMPAIQLRATGIPIPSNP